MMQDSGSLNPSFAKSIRDVAVGDSHSLTIAMSEDLVGKFADLTGDYNPLHMDEAFAKKTTFQGRIAHGMLTGSFISTIIGMYLPGPGALWLSQSYDFVAPVRIGDTVIVEAKVTRKSVSQGVIVLQMEARNQTGSLVLRGEGKVKMMEDEAQVRSKDINDCRVLVTGASRGLGARIALRFAASGAHVFANYRSSRESALDVKERAETLAGTLELVEGDVTSETGIDGILAQIGPEGVDVLIINAIGHFRHAAFLEQDIEDFEKSLDFGMRSPVRLLQRVLPSMIDQKFGRIVSILSTASIGAPPTGYSSYNVNKGALEAITKSIAVEYGKHNICANMVSPNMLRTDLTSGIAERAKQLVEAQSPLKRLPTPDEVAENVVYLCSPAAAYINGHNLILSGGSTIV